MSARKLRRHAGGDDLVEFLRTKYGAELLVEVGWVRDMPNFIRKGAHRLAFHDILLVTKGEGHYTLDGCRHVVAPRTVLFTAPRQVRQWEARDVDGLCLFFEPTFVSEFLSDTAFVDRLPYFNCSAEQALLHLDTRGARQLTRRLLEMRREFGNLRGDSEQVLRADLYAVLMQLARAHASEHPAAQRRLASPIVAAFAKLIAERVRREHRVAAFAMRLNVSANHLNALCQKHLGLSAKAVIANALAVEARRALAASDQAAEAIAESLGFKDPSYFGRFFKRMTGQSPSSFREGGRTRWPRSVGQQRGLG